MIYLLVFLVLITFTYTYLQWIAYTDYTENTQNTEYNCNTSRNEKWGGYCITKQNPYVGFNYVLDVGLAKEIGLLFKNKSIIDLGAGLGQYCDVIRRCTTCDAYDGSKNVEVVTKGKVKYLNLAKKIEFNCTHDIVMSIEVGEHIPKDYEDIYEENLIKCSNNIIILTWATIGQGGFYHVNEKEKKDVINIFTTKGLKWNEDIHKILYKSSRLDYIKNNLMVFSK